MLRYMSLRSLPVRVYPTWHFSSRRWALASIFALFPCVAFADCWADAGVRHGVSPALLYAIARTESNLNPRAENISQRTRTGMTDIGLMQINSTWLPRLAKYGITRQRLFDPCVNLHVGAWILGQCFAREGATWNCVGAYNAACTRLKGDACQITRAKYAWRVYSRLPIAKGIQR